MGGAQRRSTWRDFDDLAVPPVVGSRLDVGGFVLADPFDTILRELSETYLRAAWQRVATVLERDRLWPDDLSWGCLHPGVTYVPGSPPSAPSDYTGWTSQQLASFDRDERYASIDAVLGAGRPGVRCACTWRSHKWRIDPADVTLGLQLVEALSVDEPTDWAPEGVLREGPFASEPAHPEAPWLDVARAIRADDQARLDAALAVCRAEYSEVGYRIVVRGYAGYVSMMGSSFSVRLPDAPA